MNYAYKFLNQIYLNNERIDSNEKNHKYYNRSYYDNNDVNTHYNYSLCRFVT